MDVISIVKLVAEILLGVGGISACIALYNAKPNKVALEIKNLQSVITTLQDENKHLRTEFDNYQKSVNHTTADFKGRYAKIEQKVDLCIKAIYQAYRCPYPKTIEDCPVLISFNDSEACQNCGSNKEEK